jgi:hypothetical protein
MMEYQFTDAIMGTHVFISYARRDLPFVRDLARGLQEFGLNVWIDIHSLQPGEVWQFQIFQAIQSYSIVLIILSPHSVCSKMVSQELEQARRHGKPVVPLLLQACDAPPDLAQLHWIDFRPKFDQALELLRIRLEAKPGNRKQTLTHSPDRPPSILGFVPVAYLVVPFAVRVSTILALGSLAVKSFLGAFTLMFLDRVGVGQGGLIQICALEALAFGLLQFFLAYRAAVRRHTFNEMRAYSAIVAAASFFFPLLVYGNLTAAISSIWMIPFLVDLLWVASIYAPPSDRRWLIASPYGMGFRD